MKQLSKERLEQYAFDDRMCNVNDEIREMARRLLAVEGQEPVAWRWRQNETKPWHLTVRSDCAGEVQPLYSAPQPAPVAQPVQVLDESGMAAAHIAWMDKHFPRKTFSDEEWEEVSLYTWLAWREACRAAMLQPSQWIPCSERMPEVKSTVLVYMNEPQHSATDYAVADFDKYGFSRSKVTHWMPLPAAPQEQTK